MGFNEFLPVLGYGAAGLTGLFDATHEGSTAQQCLSTHRTRSRTDIKPAAVRKFKLPDIENRLTYAGCGGPGLLARHRLQCPLT
jgi:hypothetical protein